MTDTNELTGRELAVACARAMGWTYEGGIWHDWKGRWMGALDPEISAEDSLEWLADAASKSESDICVNITFSHEKSYVLFADCERVGECGVDYVFEKVSMRPGFHPEGLREALQRHVVAVAQRGSGGRA